MAIENFWERLEKYLYFQQSFHQPALKGWGDVGHRFEGAPFYARYTMYDWAPYQELVDTLAADFPDVPGTRVFLVDQLNGALDKLRVFQGFFKSFEVLQEVVLSNGFGDETTDTNLYLIRLELCDDKRFWSQEMKLGFVGCFPSPFRLLRRIFGDLGHSKTTSITGFAKGSHADGSVSTMDHGAQALHQLLVPRLERLAAREADHFLFTLIHTVLERFPLAVIAFDDEKARYLRDFLFDQIDEMVDQAIDTPDGYDRLCLQHELIHHALYMLSMISRPYEYADFQALSQRLNAKYYDCFEGMTFEGFVYASTMVSIMDPLLWLHREGESKGLENGGLQVKSVALCPTSTVYDSCDKVYYEIERPLTQFETKGAPNVILAGFTTESKLDEVDVTDLAATVAEGLSAHEQITVIVDNPFYRAHIYQGIWDTLLEPLRAGRVNLLIAENWHKYKGFGIEKCLGARLVVVNNNAACFRPLRDYLRSKQKAIFEHHEEFQYILSIVETGFEFEHEFMDRIEANRDHILDVDRRYAAETNKKYIFDKASVMLTSKIPEDYFLQTDIKQNCTFGFPFTSYNNFLDPDGTFVSVRIPIGLEPTSVLEAKLAGLFNAYYHDAFLRVSVLEEARQEQVRAAQTKASEQHFLPGKECSLEQTIQTIRDAIEAQQIAIDIRSETSAIAGIHNAKVAVAGIPLLDAKGKGVSAQAAMASALGEFVELLSNNIYWNFRYLGPSANKGYFTYFPREEWVSLEKADWRQSVLTPELRHYFSALHALRYEAMVDVNSPPDKPSLCAMPYHCDDDDETVLFPNNIITNLYFCNGLAAGNTKHEARVHAICEIFERYAKIKTFKHQLCLPDIPRSLCNALPAVRAAIEDLERQGFEVFVKDASMGMDLPVINVTLRERATGGVITSFGADPNFGSAIERTFTEILEERGVEELRYLPAVTSYDPLVSSFQNLYEHFELTGRGLVHARFFEDDADYAFKTWPDYGDNAQAYAHFCDLLRARHYKIYAAEFQHLGVYTCRLLVPGFSESYFYDLEVETYPLAHLLPVREDIFNVEQLSPREAGGLLHYLNQSTLSPNTSMNYALGLSSDGNGFWDDATLAQFKYLLSLKSEHAVGARDLLEHVLKSPQHSASVRPYSLEGLGDPLTAEHSGFALMSQLMSGDWRALNLTLEGHQRVIEVHDRLRMAKVKHQ